MNSSYSGCYDGTYTKSKSFFTSTLGWSESVWDFTDVENGKLPTLIQN